MLRKLRLALDPSTRASSSPKPPGPREPLRAVHHEPIPGNAPAHSAGNSGRHAGHPGPAPSRAGLTNGRRNRLRVTWHRPITRGHDRRKAGRGGARPLGGGGTHCVDTLKSWWWWHPRRARLPGPPKYCFCPASLPPPPLLSEPRPAGLCH